MIDNASLIAGNVAAVRERIAAAAARAGRTPDEITLVAVTKTHPAEAVAQSAAAGIRDVGENRVQEAEAKIAALPPEAGLRWHLIGQLQRNKARRAAHLFGLIHSVDSLRLAEALDRIVGEERPGRPLPILLQVNVAGEESKSGFDLAGGVRSADWPGFVAAAEKIAALPGLRIEGLMTIAPFSDDIEGVVRPCFRMVREVRDELARRLPEVDWRHLSMGMSGDFEAAIEEGATLVRVGTAIFGAR